MFRVFAKLTLLMMFTAFFAAQAQALFLQPDWLEVTKKGVGTNRYIYSNNDPINKKDPNGNLFAEIGAFFGGIIDGIKGCGCVGGPAQDHSATYDAGNYPNGNAGYEIGLTIDTALGIKAVQQTKEDENLEDRELGDLTTIDQTEHNKPRPELENLTDEELMEAIKNPTDGQKVKEKDGKVLDGNGRVKEAQNRGLKGTVPVEVLPSDDPLAPWEN